MISTQWAQASGGGAGSSGVRVSAGAMAVRRNNELQRNAVQRGYNARAAQWVRTEGPTAVANRARAVSGSRRKSEFQTANYLRGGG